MKIIIFGLIFFAQAIFSHVEENDHYINRGTYKLSPELFNLEEIEVALFSSISKESNDLKKAKFFLTNGKTKEAELHLSKLAYSDSKLKPIIYRYLAILSFVQGRYEKTQVYLSLPELKKNPEYGKVCTLHVLNQIVLNQVMYLQKSWDKCLVANIKRFKNVNIVWLETLIRIKLDKSEGTTKIPFEKLRIDSLSQNDLKVFLKLSIYLNQDSLMLPEISRLTADQFRDQELREIIGHIYYRNGQLVNAYRFIEDLKTPNAETMKGNLYILRGKYEVAYAQFKLALEIKNNSENALERLLPLSWILGDWKSGSEYAEKLGSDYKQLANKLTLMTAFMVQRGEFEEAEKILNYINKHTGQGTHLDVTQLHAFTKLMRNKNEELAQQAELSCQQYDMVYCWVLYQNRIWQDFPFMVRRKGEIEHKENWKELTASFQSKPIKEEVFIQQIDIEEMDDQLIKLIK